MRGYNIDLSKWISSKYFVIIQGHQQTIEELDCFVFRDFQFTNGLAAIENEFGLFFTQGRYLTDRLSTTASERYFYGHNNTPIIKHERQRRVAVCHVEQITPIGRVTVATVISSPPIFNYSQWLGLLVRFSFSPSSREKRNKPLIDIDYGTITVQRRRSARGFRSINCRDQAIQVRSYRYRIWGQQSERGLFLPREYQVWKW